MAMCVYTIEGPNGCLYIGSTKDFDVRISRHLEKLKKGRHHSPHLQLAYNKHGESAFTFAILEVVTCQEHLFTAEQGWLDAAFAAMPRRAIYNALPSAGSARGYKHTAKARQNMSMAQKGRSVSEEQRQKIAQTLKGRPLAPHVLDQFRVVNIGRTYDMQHRERIALGQTGGKLYTIVAPDGTIYEKVANVLEFAKEHGIDHSIAGLWRAINGQRKQYRGWRGWAEGAEPIPQKQSYTVIAPDGTRYSGITNPNAFAKEHGIDGHCLRAVLRGDRVQHKGWTGFREAD